jgi:hypothetical protein
MRERIAAIREASSREDRTYPLKLATIRTVAELTQDDPAHRLGIDQGLVSKMERREDMLLSSLMDHLSAAGLVDAKMVVHVNTTTSHDADSGFRNGLAGILATEKAEPMLHAHDTGGGGGIVMSL